MRSPRENHMEGGPDEHRGNHGRLASAREMLRGEEDS